MGEGKRREDSALKGMEEVVNQGERIDLNGVQAAVVFAFQRLVSALNLEANQLAQSYNQREAAGEIAGMIEHANKYVARYLADSQRSIIIPKTALVLK